MPLMQIAAITLDEVVAAIVIVSQKGTEITKKNESGFICRRRRFQQPTKPPSWNIESGFIKVP